MAYRGGHYKKGYGYPPTSKGDYGGHQQRYDHGGRLSNGYPNDYSNDYSSDYANDYGAGYYDYYDDGYNMQLPPQQQQQQQPAKQRDLPPSLYESQNSSYFNSYSGYHNHRLPRHQPSGDDHTATNHLPSSSSAPSPSPKIASASGTGRAFSMQGNHAPIVKSYALSDPKQGNFISQLAPLDEGHVPELKSFKTIHLKNENKKKNAIEYVDGLSKTVVDPRLNNPASYLKSLSKSFSKPLEKVYLPTFKFDSHSLGDKPSNEILIWNLHSTTTSLIIKNNFSQYGPISEVKVIDDPSTAVPLGMCLLSFDGKVEQAHTTALKTVELANKKLVIQGRYIRCGLNVKNQLYDEIYKKTMDVRKEKLRKQRVEEAKNEEKLKIERLRQEKLAKEEQIRLAKEARMNREKYNKLLPSGPSSKTLTNNTKVSVHDRHIFPASSFSLSYKFQKYISNRPYIFISDKYVSSMHVSSDQLRRFLSRYNISRILQQRNGFYLVFNKLSEAMQCFDAEDGKKFLNYTVYMTLYVPDDQIDETRVGKAGNVKLAQKQVVKELNAYLLKDIREKVIGKMILDVLDTDEIAKLAEESKKKKDEERHLMKQQEKEKSTAKDENTIRVIKRLDLNVVKKSVKKAFIPMSHSLNKGHDISDDDEDEDDDDEDEYEDEDASENDGTPIEDRLNPKGVPKSTKKRKPDAHISKLDKKKIKVHENIESDEEEEEVEFDDNDEIKVEAEQTDITPPSETENAGKAIDNVFQPSTAPPGPVFDDHLDPFTPTLQFLKNSVKTDEDFEILSNICKGLNFEEPIKSVEFFAWEHMEAMKESDELREEKEEDGDDAEVFDFAEEVLNNKDLRNSSGCFKTEGYHKIPDKYKREYLLHRRNLTNLNPVKHEDDDEANTLNYNNAQSSRVNRANTRRFVADISAQKQIIGETDLLDLNQLNKRKKPVQFARSAIHNWGLYALEPITAGEMIIEYVGERIRQQVAELREKKYLRSGIGSSYLFRIDENTVIDASKRGGIARFINHCCEPSCTAKIIKVGGKKRIVIYALRDVKRNEELTYDYKFEREINDEERIPCLCGAPGCKGYLN
ncbi:hypothetical protein PMKS-001309 [Pichia membranifaciens]|uniref:Histone-lysine N-methyltransferase, H3 lysine-4 specific n=1 Tax=Pichia membranifaciens TaxID=4926 RepID=A0A1Q2YEC5_9ASCO|nr:hypothetical protein PMKS-001309 [Pichia membranifaciens]